MDGGQCGQRKKRILPGRRKHHVKDGRSWLNEMTTEVVAEERKAMELSIPEMWLMRDVSQPISERE